MIQSQKIYIAGHRGMVGGHFSVPSAAADSQS